MKIEKEKKKKIDKQVLQGRRELVSTLYHKNKLRFVAIAVYSVLVAAENLVVSWLMQQIIDSISGSSEALGLDTILLISPALLVCTVLVEAINYFSHPRFIKKAMAQYREHVYKRLMDKSIASFRSESVSTYISALSNDANVVENDYLEKQFTIIRDVIMFVGAFAMMIYYSPILTVSVVVLTTLPIIATMITGNMLANAEKNVSDKNAGFLASLKDSLTGFSVIKSFKAEREMIKNFSAVNDETESAKCTKRRISIIIRMICQTASFIAQIGVFLVGAYLSADGGSVTPGIVIVFVQLMNFVIGPVMEIPSAMASRKAGRALIDKLASALLSNVRDNGKYLEPILKNNISVEDLSFGYEQGNDVIHGISEVFEAGKAYALVGSSGSGKSTLLRLLMASYDNYSGTVAIDGNNLKDVSCESLYELISIVEQDVFVFNASVRDNITMFRDFEKADVDRAIEAAGLSQFIAERGEGYLCGENGSALSGGERQRISIARSLLRKTPVLLVDEATAALDKETAAHIVSGILDLKSLLRIVVTHALDESALKRYDKIIVMKDGAVTETGTFDELMAEKGYFYSLYTVSQ